jgi:AAA+ superfamily predicted ATPase
MHDDDEAKFDKKPDDLISFEEKDGYYIIYFNASRFPTKSDDPGSNYYTYEPQLDYEPQFMLAKKRIKDKEKIATFRIYKHTSWSSPSTGSTYSRKLFREYNIVAPFDGIIDTTTIPKTSMSWVKIGIIIPKTVAEEQQEIENKIQNEYGIPKSYYDELFAICSEIKNFHSSLLLKPDILRKLQSFSDQMNIKIDDCVYQFITMDCIRCFHSMHIDIDFEKKESLGLQMIIWNEVKKESFPEYKDVSLVINSAAVFSPFIIAFENVMNNLMADDHLILPAILESVDVQLKEKYLLLLYRWCNAIANIDKELSFEEKEWLKELQSFDTALCSHSSSIIFGTQNSKIQETKKTIQTPKSSSTDKDPSSEKKPNKLPMEELSSLIGLKSVKEEIESLYNYIKIQKIRIEKGIKSPPLSYHCVFTGNPGTGKTTVARIVAQIYKELGILKKGHLVETDRSGLVAEYVGQTAIKTNSIIDKAIDGVLFIDEAYSLSEAGQGDFGKEAISTLIKRMEDDRERLVVILAGYSSNMDDFINTNPGLQSRFSRYIDFPDYSEEELLQIFLQNAKKGDYVLDENALTLLRGVLHDAIVHKDKNFGNARYVRNLFEKCIQNQANRLSEEKIVDKEKLCLLTAKDIIED